jgi:hypothetical protein
MTGGSNVAPSGMGVNEQEPFVATLRSQPTPIELGERGQPRMTIRVQVPEVWDVVRVEAPASTPVRVVKQRALDVLYPDFGDSDAFVLKLNGAVVRNEEATLSEAGAKEGSIFLLTFRRRRPVRS